MLGGEGADNFLYSATSDGATASDGSTGVTTGDLIFDFTSGNDTFSFVNSAFGFGTTTGFLAEDSFVSVEDYTGTNSGISSGLAHFVFDPLSRTLYHDSDSGSNGYTVLASVQTSIAATDVELINSDEVPNLNINRVKYE